MTATAKPAENDAIFERHRARAFSVAYRIVGSVSDAEDVVQEAWLRWRRIDPATIRNPEAWLVTTTARLGIDTLRAARARRETYVGPWLPEPMVEADAEPTPEDRLALADDVSMALLHVLERLAPEERAAFLLHDAFDYDYGELAALLGKSEAACRQTVSRARRRVHDEHARFDTSAREHARLAAAFGNAIATANPQALIECLSKDVVFYSDGGGKAIAALNPIYGADNVGRFFSGIAKKAQGVFEPRPVTVNGRPGLLLVKDEKLETVLAFAVADGRIAAIYAMRNPDKLTRVRL
ncbi:MAG: RNA polymerase sigma factor SigJ [Parvibaculum sp.]|uniref:RNA polymerase sigma factor SigJ n=1 Tax=Parvibaculum sp. TaxID=2024848 RepID=UPI001DAFA90C|nr:RNA polymerase sigma factor SigJ [Parvibaculum sp.]MBX3489316.1 RNA polymerase sigma factor SigJ [Parvibaculum sp.]MBX3495631.1 RNA polymerase sigma factor SigJ [Parvibaculum sp.]MCW5726728.1 RNA polymerase sigma factor SigJ [Parvibaculum sp.]